MSRQKVEYVVMLEEDWLRVKQFAEMCNPEHWDSCAYTQTMKIDWEIRGEDIDEGALCDCGQYSKWLFVSNLDPETLSLEIPD